jgi:hypothetical protein
MNERQGWQEVRQARRGIHPSQAATRLSCFHVSFPAQLLIKRAALVAVMPQGVGDQAGGGPRAAASHLAYVA